MKQSSTAKHHRGRQTIEEQRRTWYLKCFHYVPHTLYWSMYVGILARADTCSLFTDALRRHVFTMYQRFHYAFIHTKYCSTLAAATATTSAVGTMEPPRERALDSCGETVSRNTSSHIDFPLPSLPALSTLSVGVFDPCGGVGLMTYLEGGVGGGAGMCFTFVHGTVRVSVRGRRGRLLLVGEGHITTLDTSFTSLAHTHTHTHTHTHSHTCNMHTLTQPVPASSPLCTPPLSSPIPQKHSLPNTVPYQTQTSYPAKRTARVLRSRIAKWNGRSA
jgi:hypothetical protein